MNTDLSYGLPAVKSYNRHAANDWTVTRSCPLTAAERCVLRAIASHVDFDTGTGAWPSLSTIAAEAGVSRATVCRALNRFDELADLDYPVRVIRERRYWNGQYTSNLYTIQTRDDSRLRPPSLTVRQHDLSPLNIEPDLRDALSLTEEPEGTNPVEATPIVEAPSPAAVETTIVEPPIPSPTPNPRARNRAPKRSPVEQAEHMMRLTRERERLLREGRIIYPWQQRLSPSLAKTRIVELDYAPRGLDCSPDQIAAPLRCDAMPAQQADYAAAFLAMLRAAG